jgi:hypothetical protein
MPFPNLSGRAFPGQGMIQGQAMPPAFTGVLPTGAPFPGGGLLGPAILRRPTTVPLPQGQAMPPAFTGVLPTGAPFPGGGLPRPAILRMPTTVPLPAWALQPQRFQEGGVVQPQRSFVSRMPWGGLAGTALGGVVGGPIGAIAGGILGRYLQNRMAGGTGWGGFRLGVGGGGIPISELIRSGYGFGGSQNIPIWGPGVPSPWTGVSGQVAQMPGIHVTSSGATWGEGQPGAVTAPAIDAAAIDRASYYNPLGTQRIGVQSFAGPTSYSSGSSGL